MLHVRCCAMYLCINKHEISVETTKPCVYLIENFKYCNITLSMLLTYLILCKLQIFQICKFKRKLRTKMFFYSKWAKYLLCFWMLLPPRLNFCASNFSGKG